jgi:hypothetical protein
LFLYHYRGDIDWFRWIWIKPEGARSPWLGILNGHACRVASCRRRGKCSDRLQKV